ncbi:hypothetical protein JVU11DRAFT_3778 [Chiua virens]|nr:hypothetical protein JVU11DRAFT_3778 [Chiua virens]
MSKTSTHLKDLQVGDLIWANVVLDIADLVDLKSTSSTAKKTKEGKPTRRICLVLEAGATSVRVTYVATFNESNTLPTALDKTMWYPFRPATKEGDLEPLPPMREGIAQWASLRSTHTITNDPVYVLPETVSVETAGLIRGKIYQAQSNTTSDAACTGWQRFTQVTNFVPSGHKLYRASGPSYRGQDSDQDLTEKAVDFLVSQGIDGIISFNEHEYNEVEKERLVKVTPPIQYLHLKLGDFKPPTLGQFKQAHDFFLNNRSTLVHCGYGWGRTGTGITGLQILTENGKSLQPLAKSWSTRLSSGGNNVEMREQISILSEQRNLLLPRLIGILPDDPNKAFAIINFATGYYLTLSNNKPECSVILASPETVEITSSIHQTYQWVVSKDNQGNYTLANKMSPNSFALIKSQDAKIDDLVMYGTQTERTNTLFTVTEVTSGERGCYTISPVSSSILGVTIEPPRNDVPLLYSAHMPALLAAKNEDNKFGLWIFLPVDMGNSESEQSARKQQSSSAPSAKRRRGGQAQVPAFGAPTEGDTSLLQPSHCPSATASSIRTLPQATVPSLSSLAARCFVMHVRVLSENERLWMYSKRCLKLLPDTLVPKLFSMLRSNCPTLLSHGLIVLYFLRGPSLVLSNDLPGVQKQTIASITNNSVLRELHLIGLEKFSDTLFASILPALPHLRVLVLRGCSKVGSKTAEAIGNACPSLTTLNLNYTSVPPGSLLGPLNSCTNLEVLKVAGISNWTDGTFVKLLTGLARQPDWTLPHMRSLKFRQLGLSETSMSVFIGRCPNLTRLDVSFTRFHRLPPTPVNFAPALEKLSLTSAALSSMDIVSLISALPNLHTLYLGALGTGQGSSASINNISAMTMTDDTLTSLIDVMQHFQHLEKFSLVGNTKLGLTSRHDEQGALADLIRRVGRKCKHLNLSSIPYLRSSDLCGLISESVHDDPPKLEVLAINNTGIDDDAAPFLASCSSLVVLEVAGTKLTSSGLFPIIDACPRLEKLDLTSCRGIRVADRRRFFEVMTQDGL